MYLCIFVSKTSHRLVFVVVLIVVVLVVVVLAVVVFVVVVFVVVVFVVVVFIIVVVVVVFAFVVFVVVVTVKLDLSMKEEWSARMSTFAMAESILFILPAFLTVKLLLTLLLMANCAKHLTGSKVHKKKLNPRSSG